MNDVLHQMQVLQEALTVRELRCRQDRARHADETIIKASIGKCRYALRSVAESTLFIPDNGTPNPRPGCIPSTLFRPQWEDASADYNGPR